MLLRQSVADVVRQSLPAAWEHGGPVNLVRSCYVSKPCDRWTRDETSLRLVDNGLRVYIVRDVCVFPEWTIRLALAPPYSTRDESLHPSCLVAASSRGLRLQGRTEWTETDRPREFRTGQALSVEQSQLSSIRLLEIVSFLACIVRCNLAHLRPAQLDDDPAD